MNWSRFKLVLKNPGKVFRFVITKDVPLFAHIYITRRCNLRCKKCKVVERKSKELKLRDWKKIMDKMASWGTSIVTIQGGEGMIRKDIYDILSYSSTKFSTTFVTNAVLLDKKKIDKLIDTGITNFVFSLDSLSAAKEAKMGRGTVATKKVIESLEYLQTLKEKPKISVICVATRLNVDEIPKLAKFVDEHDANFSISVLESAPGDHWWFRNYAPSLEFRKKDFQKMRKMFKQLIELKKQGVKVSTPMQYLIDAQKYIEGKMKIPCDAAKLYYSVNPDGTFMGCQDIAPISNKRIDKMESFKEAWESKQMQKDIRTCPGCFYGCYYSVSYLARKPWSFLKGEILY